MKEFTMGIPRALLYYDFLPQVEVFFNALGIRTIISPKTTKETIEKGNQLSIDEACLPVKVCMGHLSYFEKKHVDMVFLPRVISIEKNKFICPKFLGLPDYAKGALGNLRFFSPDIKVDGFKEFSKSLYQLTKDLPISKKTLAYALKEVEKNHKLMKDQLQKGKDLDVLLNNKKFVDKPLKVALLGHGYNIYDGGISLSLLDKISEVANIKTVEMYTDQEINLGKLDLPKPLFWTYGEKILASALYSLKYSDVDGVVLVTSFGCGPDSFINELIIQAHKKNSKVPLMILTLDEHSAEAGIVTRLEAFMDLLSLRRNKLWA